MTFVAAQLCTRNLNSIALLVYLVFCDCLLSYDWLWHLHKCHVAVQKSTFEINSFIERYGTFVELRYFVFCSVIGEIVTLKSSIVFVLQCADFQYICD